jgi:hypothetical protein
MELDSRFLLHTCGDRLRGNDQGGENDFLGNCPFWLAKKVPKNSFV